TAPSNAIPTNSLHSLYFIIVSHSPGCYIMEISIFQALARLHRNLRRISGRNYWQIPRPRARCPRTCHTNNGRVEEQVVAFTAVRGGGLGGGRNLLPLKMRFGPISRGPVLGCEVKRGRSHCRPVDTTNWTDHSSRPTAEFGSTTDKRHW